ncbi:hypothetical protein ACEQPO_27885 [Bacillus sp. SL00103]
MKKLGDLKSDIHSLEHGIHSVERKIEKEKAETTERKRGKYMSREIKIDASQVNEYYSMQNNQALK